MFRRHLHLSAAAVLLCSTAALAQNATDTAPTAGEGGTPPPADSPHGRVEMGLGYAVLNGGNSNWSDQYVRGHVGLKPGTTLNWDLASQRHFGQRGTVGALSLTQDLSPLWYMSVGASSGSADFQNKYRGDLAIYRKWTDTQQWVSGLALMKSASRDGIHRDTGVTASLAYYSTQAWVAEGGVVYNRSSPGSVDGFRGFGAITLGTEKDHYLVARIDHGKEAYLPIGAIASGGDHVGFQSTELTLQWRQWVTREWGYTVGGQLYRNPYYRRVGVSAAVFFDF